MKILWIEDFGGGLNGLRLAEEIFADIIPAKTLNKNEELYLQLPEAVAANSVHELFLCQSYTDFVKIYKDEEGDFDLFLIDINLEHSATYKKDRPASQKGNADFDLKAGLFIYNQLVRKFPERNIAFFTAESNTLTQFKEYCSNAMIELPINTFGKNENDFPKVRKWLKERLNDEYSILRRGIIEGCEAVKKFLSTIPNNELEGKFLFYKTTSLNIKNDIELYQYELIDYLEYLKDFFTLHERSGKYHAYSLFIRDLSKNWERSFGDFSRSKNKPSSDSPIEANFYELCQMFMKLLRNWTSHDLLTNELFPKDVAYFFLIAMRSWVQLDINKVYKYEKILATLFDSSTVALEELKFLNVLEKNLFESYRGLQRDIPKELKINNSIKNQFVVMMDALGRSAKGYEENGDIADLIKRKIQDKSAKLFYDLFWHGLFPIYFETNPDGKESVLFDFEESIDGDSFVYFIGQKILSSSFN